MTKVHSVVVMKDRSNLHIYTCATQEMQRLALLEVVESCGDYVPNPDRITLDEAWDLAREAMGPGVYLFESDLIDDPQNL